MRYAFISDDKKTLALYEEGKEVQILRQVANELVIPTKPVAHDESTKRPYTKRGRGVRHCKNCGEEGHRSDNCPKSSEAPKPTGKRRGRPRQNDFEADVNIDTQGARMSDDELQEKINAFREEGLDSLKIAATLRIPLSKVNQFWKNVPPDEEELIPGIQSIS